MGTQKSVVPSNPTTAAPEIWSGGRLLSVRVRRAEGCLTVTTVRSRDDCPFTARRAAVHATASSCVDGGADCCDALRPSRGGRRIARDVCQAFSTAPAPHLYSAISRKDAGSNRRSLVASSVIGDRQSAPPNGSLARHHLLAPVALRVGGKRLARWERSCRPCSVGDHSCGAIRHEP